MGASEAEPNNDIISPNGPISSVPYTGTLESEQDDDWFWLQLAGDQQVTISAAFFGGDCSFPDAEITLRDYYGKEIASLGPSEYEGELSTYHYTTPPQSSTFYIEAEGNVDHKGCRYEFQVSPPSAFAPAPVKPPIITMSEPDDFTNQAYGPISADTVYAGKIETINDVDQMYFEAKPNQSITTELAGGSCNGHVEATISPIGESKGFPQSVSGSYEERGHETFDTYSGGRFYVAVTGDYGCDWQFMISPPPALGAEHVTHHHVSPCQRAKRLLGRRRQHLHRLERTLRFASREKRSKIRRKVRARKRNVRAARHAVRVNCKAS